MPVNEALGVLAQIVICIEGSLQDLKGDVLGLSQGQPSAAVEGDDAERVAVLAGQEMRMMVLRSALAGSVSS
jgi:hypothetical protein